MLEATLAKPRRTTKDSSALSRRARKIMQAEIAFIPNSEFAALAASEAACESAERASAAFRSPPLYKDCSPAVSQPRGFLHLSHPDLLKPGEELELFRQMNFLKYRANILRCGIDPRRPNEAELDLIERLMEISRAARDRLVQANLRLVLSIAKQFDQNRQGFEDLVSEGCHTLLRAIEKFDYSRGFRLSTYATHAIRRNLYQLLLRRKKERLSFEASPLEAVADCADEHESASTVEARWEKLRGDLSVLMDRLDPREQSIISARFGLGPDCQPRTLQSLSADLGVCKERVRQLEQRALEKLRHMADELHIEDPTT